MYSIISSICSSLPATLLKESLKTIGSDGDSSKNGLVDRVVLDIAEIGVEEVVVQFSDETVRSCRQTQETRVDSLHSSTDGNQEELSNPPTPHLLLEAHIKEIKMESFLTGLSQDVLNLISKDLGIKPRKDTSTMIHILAEETLLSGLESFFCMLTIQVLKKWCQALDVKSQGKKQEIIERLMLDFVNKLKNQDPKETDQGQDEVVALKPVPAKDTVIADEPVNYDKMKVVELKERLARLSLKTDGKKDLLIKRLKDYYQTLQQNKEESGDQSNDVTETIGSNSDVTFEEHTVREASIGTEENTLQRTRSDEPKRIPLQEVNHNAMNVLSVQSPKKKNPRGTPDRKLPKSVLFSTTTTAAHLLCTDENSDVTF